MSESSSYTEINSNNNNSTGSTDSNNSCSSRTSNKAYTARIVALKCIKTSTTKGSCADFLEEVRIHVLCSLEFDTFLKIYGMTKNPKTLEYMMVTAYANRGNLRDYLEYNFKKLKWTEKLNYLANIATDLDTLHTKKFVHKDLHTGNILQHSPSNGEKIISYLTDFGLTKSYKDKTNLAECCLDKSPKKRPTAKQLSMHLYKWSWSISDNPISDIGRDFLASDEYIANSDPSKGKLHPEAIYVSRFIKFPKIENDDNDISDSDDDGDSTRESKSIQIPKANEESFEELSNSPESLKSPRSPGLQGFDSTLINLTIPNICSELFETTEETLVESDSKQLVLTLSKAIPNFSSNQLRTVIETEENSQIDSQEGLTLSAVLNGLSLEDKVKYKINDEEVSLAAIFRSLDSRQLDLCILKACLNGDDITESHQSSDVPGEVDKNLEIVIIESE
ncbi:6911_t:CDS:10 [Entrophospora sp. SA101]|nr:6911_t:CDS:10 [Entrophospora sp. SA101]